MRLIGDDRQLAAVAAGGVLRDLAHQVGAVTLSEVRRFLNADGSLNLAEAAATLAVRDGRPLRARVLRRPRPDPRRRPRHLCRPGLRRLGRRPRRWRRALLLAPTRELVAELNTRARSDRLAGQSDNQIGPVLTLRDGTEVSAGDPVITRHNDRRLAVSNTDWVKNGDRWTITHVHADGSLTVRHSKLDKLIRLPADYVSDHVQLGYATTVHGAQGTTVDACHVVLTGAEDRNLLYVALSRGRYANHLYLAPGTDGDPHSLVRPEALVPPTALDQLAADPAPRRLPGLGHHRTPRRPSTRPGCSTTRPPGTTTR